MLCPGMSYDEDGRLIVTGDWNVEVTSISTPGSRAWTRAQDIIIPRGYQTSTLTSENKVFTIPGSWEGIIFLKDGGLFDPSFNTWTMLPRAQSKPALTADVGGLYCSDNHA